MKKRFQDLKIFADLSHAELAREICLCLNDLVVSPSFMTLGESKITIFGNGNPIAEVQESVRGKDVFVIGTQAPPACQNFMAFCILLDALHFASAGRVTAVMPYLFESRSDKKDRPRISIVARLVATFLSRAGADRFLGMDLHVPQIQGFFQIPTDVLEAAPILCDFLKKRDLTNYVLLVSDAGEGKRLDPLREGLPFELPIASFDKRRRNHKEKAEIVGFIGDVAGKVALMVDDEIASGSTIEEGCKYLFAKLPPGARPLEVRAMATHPVLSGNAIKTLNESGIKELIVVNTIPVPEEKIKLAQFEINILSPAKVIAQAIKFIHEEDSVSQLWNNHQKK